MSRLWIRAVLVVPSLSAAVLAQATTRGPPPVGRGRDAGLVRVEVAGMKGEAPDPAGDAYDAAAPSTPRQPPKTPKSLEP